MVNLLVEANHQFCLVGIGDDCHPCICRSNVEAGDYILNELQRVTPVWTRFSSASAWVCIEYENEVKLFWTSCGNLISARDLKLHSLISILDNLRTIILHILTPKWSLQYNYYANKIEYLRLRIAVDIRRTSLIHDECLAWCTAWNPI